MLGSDPFEVNGSPFDIIRERGGKRDRKRE
jgi:hypothetical protein